MKEIFFHVGLGKVASTYLQYAFFPKLKGLQYIQRTNYQKSPHIVKKSSEKRFLVSREFDQQLEEECRWFSSFFPEARIILIFRRHDSWIASQYRRYLKNGESLTFTEFIDVKKDNGLWKLSDLDFYKKIEAIQHFLQQGSQAIDPEDQKNVQNLIAIGEALKAYIKNIERHTSAMMRTNKPNLDKALRQEIAAFCQSVCNITQIDLTTDEGKKEFLALTGLEQTALPKTEGIVIDVTHNANPPPQLPENIKFQKIDGIILPPDLRAGPQTGYGKGWQEAENQYRLNYVLAYLGEQNIRYDPTLLVIGEDPRQYDHMREESYVVVRILDETGTPKAQLFVNNYSGEAIFVVAPPLTNDDLTTMGKAELKALNNTTRITFDEVQGKWKITLLRAIQDIQKPNFPNIATPTDAVPKRSKAENPNGNNVIINAYLKNPQATAEALRKAFTEAFGKPAAKIRNKEIQSSNKSVTVILPSGAHVDVLPSSLYWAFFRFRSEVKSLPYVVQSKEALTRYSRPRIIDCLLKDFENTQKAICDAVEKVKDVFPQDKDKKPIVSHQAIEQNDPVLTITLPTGEIVEIYMEALDQLLSRKENKGLPTLLNLLESPRAATQIENRKLIAALLDPRNREEIIQRIKAELPTGGDLRRRGRDYSISFEIDDSIWWEGTALQLYDTLKNHHRNNPKIPTLTQIRNGTYRRDDTYQETAEAAAASGTPPQAPEIDPTYTIFNQHQHG